MPGGRFSSPVERDLRAAGWHPGRAVDVTGWRQLLEAGDELRMHRAAAEFLAEFGGLNVEIDGPGLTAAREPFELDPELCVGEEDRFAEWGADLGCSLFPLGGSIGGVSAWGSPRWGEIFLVEAGVGSFGIGDAALENLVLGVMPSERFQERCVRWRPPVGG
ncbi:SUKH-3 domain-containing protein [Lentzea sp.]|uniref:SUKH-3 domain-containing protein n=1 Tax=Lentzea sp. TaxID=56099 RepID=UPI002B76A871|nr:SUKH-3 domain-containing protein [Lentzea sp.]HUQ59163.1 SUKH-3 domain-containing protein [Lentzea sp.]